MKALQSRLETENLFVTGLFDLMYVPKHKGRATDSDEDENEALDVSDEVKRSVIGKTSRARTLGELQDRLQRKMAEFRGQKGSKASKGAKTKLSKVEKRQKSREAQKLKKKLLASGQAVKSPAQKKSSGNKVKPSYNHEGKMVFSKFDFSEDGSSSKKKQSLDPKSALQKVQRNKEKLKSLEEIGKTDRAKVIKEKTAWTNAMQRAGGEKVKDDEALLKKSVKKMEQRKKSSKKKWDARQATVEKQKETHQLKRSENIQKKKDHLKQKKLKKAAKKGRLIPGFS